VRRFSSKIKAAALERPILDVACGSGRNALHFCQLGCTVVCTDKNLDYLTIHSQLAGDGSFRTGPGRLILKQLDLIRDAWPFGRGTSGGIINVHFFVPSLLPLFESSLAPGGYLLLETPPGHGGNYLELPASGTIRAALTRGFEIEFYRERKVGPPDYDAVSVQLFAQRRG
jgi:SAM-dependent methyltransferase